ncbi:MAG: branched-chain amino acid ABC transporter permease [Thermodesulfobacteriota bacterium]
MTLDSFLYTLAGGVVLGSLYALMAVGLAVVWTTLGIFNFSHGVFIAAGAYITWQAADAGGWGLGLTLAAVIGVTGVFALGLLFQTFLIRPFQKKGNLVLLAVITTLAGASLLENATVLLWGGRSKQLPRVIQGDVSFLGVNISAQEGLIILLVPALLFLLWLLLHKTHLGLSMRAVAQNREAAELMGLNVQRLYLTAFGLSAGLAGLAGVFLGSIRFITPAMGNEPLMKALIVIIFGGVARLTSPIKAAYVIGLLEAFSIYFFGLYWAATVLFGVMILVLMIKPEGLFGRFERIVP